ncbi:PREDICTED: U4/U6.U5 tri-snRNP-associated protein 2-like [Amphimedon queenslandica]|uniref:Ubiquitin carboxyl-terminal hydrolase 39 n=1 Tax=Amphimedon queenslandica TaxID=400682 RepID=A0A1X7VMH3_AMPQE|nr:PREDICTED: U4/U6.U5 tri-snRNP-associated protein 2-like [Amphimedon queenslandica]|eukprot:XP_019863948.1 PREDICTED: U4/U6.U5 tri-snRNP-associated protein 2-like [Amphimedon queenslandica]
MAVEIKEEIERKIKREKEEEEEEKEENGDEDEDEFLVPRKRLRTDQMKEHPLSRNCPYLDTINRSILDFDFEKLCTVSLSNNNVYACLVCGKYFQGRGQHSHAYIHSVQHYHYVFLNLKTLQFYCLPDNYEIIDPSLEDIKHICRPTFTSQEIESLDKSAKWMKALDETKYLPGILGLNNIKANDYMNVILHTLAHITPFRDYFLNEDNYLSITPPPGDQTFTLVHRLGELFRKLWNPRYFLFRAHVSPHEMLQAVSSVSKKRFKIVEQGDPVEFMSWLLNTLHFALSAGKRKNKSSIVYDTFQGEMKIYTRKLPPQTENEDEMMDYLKMEEYKQKEETTPFLYLALDLPAPPLFQDELEKNIIPQIPLFDLLKKFDGTTEKEYKTHRESYVKKFELTKLPPYLILCIKRFTKNNFFVEKNPTIVNFPIKDIDMSEFLSSDPAVQDSHPHTVYDLVANVCHDGQAGPGKGTYRVHLRHKGANQWYELQDLNVKDLLPQMITLAEAYIQIWELRKD